MTTTGLITGKVAGFALVIDPENYDGKFARIEFSDAASMKARISQINREDAAALNSDPRNYNPVETSYRTVYRRDDTGVTEDEVGFDFGVTNVGDAAHKKFCKCGKSSWWKTRPGWSLDPVFTCEGCNKPDDNDSGGDFSNYDGSQEREY